MKTIVLLSTHFINDFIVGQIKKINKEKLEKVDFVVLSQNYNDKSCLDIDNIKTFLFSIKSLNQLGYNPIAETIIPGSNHFPVLQFYKDHPEYDYYWNIEYDVCFNGNWNTIFSFFEEYNFDFITSHIQNIRQNPSWEHWDMMELNHVYIPFDGFLKSFNPIYRISNKALNFLDRFLKKGNSGHHELLIPTVLNHFGFTIADMGGDGSYIIDNQKDLFYTSNKPLDLWYNDSSMRYRPLYKTDEMKIKDMLYHPIKN